MQAGIVYNDFAEDLFNRRFVAKRLFNEFNHTTDEEIERSQDIMRRLLKSIGERYG